MQRISRGKFAKLVTTIPAVKNSLLWVINTYYRYRPWVEGNVRRNPGYLWHRLRSRVIAKPGTLGFDGGVFNPGALFFSNNKILLIARSQTVPWFNALGKKRNSYLVGSPVVFILDRQSLSVQNSFVVENLIGFPEDDSFAIEDFRIFQFRDSILINHSFIRKGLSNGDVFQASVSSALSFYDQEEKNITFVGIPIVDFEVETFEKNWVFVQDGERLLLFYSVAPFRVLAYDSVNHLSFKTIVEKPMPMQISDPGGFESRVSFSTNPINYDDQHWLVIIHQIKHRVSWRSYFHWAVLIEKKTLVPAKISKKPIFNGMDARGRVPGYRYISSVLIRDGDLLFFAGEGDVYVTVTKKSVKELDTLFVPVDDTLVNA